MPLNIDFQQILLHWMNLAILTGGLYVLLYKPVKQFMDKREAHYQAAELGYSGWAFEGGRVEANREKNRLQIFFDAIPGEEIRQARAKAQQSAQQAAQEQLDQAQAQAQHIVAKAQAEAEQSRERIRRESQRELRELAAQAAKRLAARPGTDPFDQFLDLAEGGKSHESR